MITKKLENIKGSPLSLTQIHQYLTKIGYYSKNLPQTTELPKVNFDSLCLLMDLHLKAIPFGALAFSYIENNQEQKIDNNSSNKILIPKISMNVNDIFNKLIIKNREGYCFEQNTLMRYVLSYLGFDCLFVMAKVVDLPHFIAKDEIKAGGIQHVVTIVNLEGKKYMVDVGFAPGTPTRPIELDSLEPTDGSTYIQNRVIKSTLIEEGDCSTSMTPTCYLSEFRIPLFDQKNDKSETMYSVWKPQFYFYLIPCHPSDLEVLNFNMCFNPDSHFINHILLSKITEGGQIMFFDNELTIYKLGRVVSKEMLNTEQERRKAYKYYFNIDLPDNFKEKLPY